jgi:hypothetical protein
MVAPAGLPGRLGPLDFRQLGAAFDDGKADGRVLIIREIPP